MGPDKLDPLVTGVCVVNRNCILQSLNFWLGFAWSSRLPEKQDTDPLVAMICMVGVCPPTVLEELQPGKSTANSMASSPGGTTSGSLQSRHSAPRLASETRQDMWQWIDTDKSGSVTIAEFFEGFEMLNEPFRQKTLGSPARLAFGTSEDGGDGIILQGGFMAWS